MSVADEVMGAIEDYEVFENVAKVRRPLNKDAHVKIKLG